MSFYSHCVFPCLDGQSVLLRAIIPPLDQVFFPQQPGWVEKWLGRIV
jgi:hypothetical protein